MAPLSFSRKAHERDHSPEPEIAGCLSAEAGADIDLREVYFLIMHFLSSGPCRRTYVQIWNELLEHDLLPRRYHAWYSRSGAPSGDENDNGSSLPLSYSDLVIRYPHVERDHLVKLLKQLILCSSSPLNGVIGGNFPNGTDVSTLLGSSSFSLLRSDKDRELEKVNHLPRYLRWPHMQANQVHGLSLREIGGGFAKHRRAPSVRAACYAIAKPSTMVQKMQVIRKLRGHQNAVYCAIFDRTGRYVVTGSDDRLVKIWSMETAFCLSSCRGHEGDITDLAISSNNALVASASNDFIIRVWRLPDGLPISVLRGHTGAVTAIAFSPRPSSVYHLLSSSDDGTCRIWDARYSQSSPRVYVPKPLDGVPGRSSNPTPNSGQQQVHQILCCAYNANGTVFVTGSSDTYARVWNACKTNPEDSEQPNHEMDLLSGHENDVNYVQFSGCAVSSKFSSTDNSKEDNIPKFKNSWFTHDNIVTCSRDGSAIIWIPRSRRSHGKVGRWTRAYHLKVPPPPMPPQTSRGGPRQRFQPTPRGVNMIVWSLDNRFVLAAIMDCRICVWNASDGSLVHSLMGHDASTFVLDVHPFNPRIAMSAGYDGKTIIWDIWEGTPVRIYETGRFKLVDGKFSPDGTSVVLSDEVGQIFIIATGQGESQKDAKYDQFFLGDYRPLIQDVHGNVMDQETQLAPYRRNIQDLLCDSSMIPYPEPYQNMYQRRRLGALGIEWRPPSMKFAVGPSNNVNAGDYQILPIVDLERWVETLETVPQFVDAMDWEQENEVQSDDTDSEYNVTEEISSEREQGSLSISSTGDQECSAEESDIGHTTKEGLRRSKRKKPKPEVEFTSSGRRVKRRNLDEHDHTTTRRQRKRRKRNGKLTTRKKSSKSTLHRPQRRAARNALTFLSQMDEVSTEEEEAEEEEEEEEDDSETYSSDNDSLIPDSYDQSNESDRSFLTSRTEHKRGKEIKRDECEEIAKSSLLNEVQANAGNKRRLVLRLPVRDSKKILPSESLQPRNHEQDGVMVSSAKKCSDGHKTDGSFPVSWEPGQSSGDKVSQDDVGIKIRGEHVEKFGDQPAFSSVYQGGKVKWGEVKTRSSKRIRLGDTSATDTWSAPSMSNEVPCVVTSNANGHLKFENNECRMASSHSRNLPNGDHSCGRDYNTEVQNTDGISERLDGSRHQESGGHIKRPLVLNQLSPRADLPERDVLPVTCNGTETETDQNVYKEFEYLSGTKEYRDSDERQGADMGLDNITSSAFNDVRGNDHSQDVKNNTQPVYRKLRITSKQSMYDPGSSSSKLSFAVEDGRSSKIGLTSNSNMQMEHNQDSVLHEEVVGSSGSSDNDGWRSGSRKSGNSRIQNTGGRRSKSSRGRGGSRGDIHGMDESISNYENHNGDRNLDMTDSMINSLHHTRSSSTRTATDRQNDIVNSFRERESYDSGEPSRSGLKFSINGCNPHQDDDWKKSTSRATVGLRSARNRRENYNSCDLSPLNKRRAPGSVKKLSWLMLSEHEESYRYIPQLGDEVAYLRQGHAEYLDTRTSHEVGPWRLMKVALRSVEFCIVKTLEYSTLPGSGESCCKLTLEFTDPSSCAFGKAFKLTLPELVEFPDFLVERTRYNAAIERNWTHRDKCQVWWRNEDGEGGSWWEGRILAVKHKSPEFPDSPWERFVVQYKNDSSEQHQHSPWELYDVDTQWAHPHIDDMSTKKLLSSFAKIVQTSLRNQDSYGLQKLNQVSQKSDFLNRFPVPLSLEVIKRRLENDYYRSLEAVRHDAHVMLANVQTYFAKTAEFAAKMRRLSESISRFLPPP